MKLSSMESISLLKPYIKENSVLIFFGVVFLIIVDILQLYIPRIIKCAIDDIAAFQIDLPGLMMYSFYIVGIALIMGIFRYAWRRCLIGLSRKVEEGLRNRLFAHIQTLSAPYFDKVKTGDLMAHATNDIGHVRMATGMGMVALTDAVVLGFASVCFMLYINKLLTLFVLIPMPLIMFGTMFFSKKMHLAYKKVQESFSDMTEIVRERFAGIRIIKAYHKEQKEISRVAAISETYIAENISLVKIIGVFFPMMILFSNLSLAIVLYLGGRKTIYFTITPGDFVAFISYLGLLTWPMMAIGWVTNLMQRGRASLDRINVILQTRPDINYMPGACSDEGIPGKTMKKIRGEIVFENVSFAYKPGMPASLTGITFKLDQGKILGLTGPSGSGKTTVINLIPRVYDVSHGRIMLNGIDVRNIKINDLRTQISFVSQEPFLFSGTIRENIIFYNKNIKEAELIRAVKQASLYDTIRALPDGFETNVGEKGVILSGGQKQRIALARAFLRDASILILDDPISQVDVETGKNIITAIRSMAGYMTIIIISHRISALRFADLITVFDKGHITESGSHIQLMENDKYYAKTFRLQEIQKELNAT